MFLTSSHSNLEKEVDVRRLSISLKFKVVISTKT